MEIVYNKKDLAAIGKASFVKKIDLLVITDIHPFVKQFGFLRAVLGQLCGSYQGQPLLYITPVGVCLFAEQFHVLVCSCLIFQTQKQIGTGGICTGIALSCMNPVQDIHGTIIGYDDIVGLEITMTQLHMLGHAVQSCQEVITIDRV